MRWFKHQTNALSNNKLTKVRMKYGAEGYAIYWYCLELIASDLGESKDCDFELKHDAEVIGFNLKIDQLRVEEIMNFMVVINLFEQSEGIVSCIKLAKYLDKKNTRSLYIHGIIDQAKTKETNKNVGDKLPTVADKSGQTALEVDLDLEIDKEKTIVSNKVPDCPHKEILKLYAEILPTGVQPRSWDSSDTEVLKSRWRESKARQNIKWWTEFFIYIAKSDFLMGNVETTKSNQFIIKLPWIIKKTNFKKIIDGNYENRN